MYMRLWQHDDATTINWRDRYCCRGTIRMALTRTSSGSVMQLLILNFDLQFLSLSFPPSSSFIFNYAKYSKNIQETQPMFNLKFYLGPPPYMQSQLLLESLFTDRLIIVFFFLFFKKQTNQQPVFLSCSSRRLKENLVSHKLGFNLVIVRPIEMECVFFNECPL